MWGSIPQAPGRVLNPAGAAVLRLRGYPHRQPLPASHLPPPPPSDAPGQAARTVTAHDLGQGRPPCARPAPRFSRRAPGSLRGAVSTTGRSTSGFHGRPTGAASCAHLPGAGIWSGGPSWVGVVGSIWSHTHRCPLRRPHPAQCDGDTTVASSRSHTASLPGVSQSCPHLNGGALRGCTHTPHRSHSR